MSKVGRFITDPGEGALCHITLDSGEKILINHDRGGFKGGRISISQTKWLGLSGDTFFTLDLDTSDGKEALARLTRGADPTSVRATPLGALVDYVKDCQGVAEVKGKCLALAASQP
jgi:hypothetical protein